jgi:Ca-activated chloride channel family protein
VGMKKEMNNNGLDIALVSARDAIAREGGNVHLEVRVTPPPAAPRADRRPVALALVIDRSGSMSAPAALAPEAGLSVPGAEDGGFPTRLAFVQEASLRLLDLLQDGDLLSLVTFDNAVQVVRPMTRVEAATREGLATAIRGIVTRGSTNVEGAIREGYEQFTPAIRKAHSCKLLLLSDGEANVGETRPAVLGEGAAGAAHNGVATSTLGVGFDYNIALMAHLAEAGNGDFTHVEGLGELDRQLREELAGAAEVTAAAAAVHVAVPDGASVGTNLNGYPQVSEAGGFRVDLGNLVRAKSFIFEVSTPAKVSADVLTVAARVEAVDPSGMSIRAVAETTLKLVSKRQSAQAATDTELVRRVLEMIKASALGNASNLYDGGDPGAATVRLRQSVAFLDQAAGTYGDKTLDLQDARAELQRMLDAVETGVLSAVDAKRAYMQSSMVMQSRVLDGG